MYRAAIVGCGRIASEFDADPKRKGSIASHAGAYNSLSSVVLNAAADVDQKKLKQFGEKWGVDKLYSDYRELLEKESIDILSICTWSSTHREICERAVESGVKAIFCEKPITESLRAADEMVAICKNKGVLLAIDHSRRWDEMHQQIKDYIQSGKLGKIQKVSAYYTGGIANTGTHLLDILRFFFGDVAWVWSNFAGQEQETDPSIDAYLYFKQGFGATLQGLEVKNYLIFEIDIFGEKGRIRIKNSGFNTLFWEVIDHSKFSGYKCLGSMGNEMFGSGLQNCMIRAIENIINSLKTGDEPKSTGNDGRAALELICAIHESKGNKIFLPLNNRDILIKSK